MQVHAYWPVRELMPLFDGAFSDLAFSLFGEE
jgi:hypothetical protein